METSKLKESATVEGSDLKGQAGVEKPDCQTNSSGTLQRPGIEQIERIEPPNSIGSFGVTVNLVLILLIVKAVTRLAESGGK